MLHILKEHRRSESVTSFFGQLKRHTKLVVYQNQRFGSFCSLTGNPIVCASDGGPYEVKNVCRQSEKHAQANASPGFGP
jgi:hypothetical protein